jgi:hypothetical protein
VSLDAPADAAWESATVTALVRLPPEVLPCPPAFEPPVYCAESTRPFGLELPPVPEVVEPAPVPELLRSARPPEVEVRWTQRKSSLSRRQNCLGAPNQWVEHHCSLRARSARRSFRLSRTWDCHRKDWLRKHRGAARRWSIPSRSKNPARVRRASPSVRATRRLFLWTDASSDIVPTAWLPPLLDLSEKGQHPPIEGLGFRRPYDFVK